MPSAPERAPKRAGGGGTLEPDDPRQHALRAARLGYAVAPLQRDSKVPPRGVSWKRVATSDSQQAARLLTAGANYAIVPDADTMGLDCDDAALVPELERLFPELAEAPAVDTVRGGRHWYVRAPGWDLKTRAGVHPGVDVKGFGRGYLVGPGSAIQERCYRIVRPLVPPDQLPVGSDALRQFLTPPQDEEPAPSEPPRAAPVGAPSADAAAEARRIRAWADAALDEECGTVKAAPEGARNHTLNRAAFSLGQIVGAGHLDDATVRDALMAASRHAVGADGAPIPAHEARATIQSGLQKGRKHPRHPPEREGHAHRSETDGPPPVDPTDPGPEADALLIPNGMADAPAPDAAAAPNEPVDLAHLLDEVRAFLARFLAVPPVVLDALALWVAHTHAIAAFHTTPRLALLSPEPGSGKTRVLELLAILVQHGLLTFSATSAAIFRSLQLEQHTLLMDETDALFRQVKNGETVDEDLRALVNAGYRRGNYVLRVVGHKHEVQRFPAFAAVALAGLGDLPPTVMDRAIVIRMRKRSANEPVEPYYHRVHEPEGHQLRAQLDRWADEALERLADAWPELPTGVMDRPAELWQPLLVVADDAGGHWPDTARAACIHFTNAAQEREPSLNVRLLADIRTIMLEPAFVKAGHVSTETLLDRLNGMPEAPWGSLYGRAMDARSLARRLRPYEIRSAKVRTGSSTLQGYRHEDMADAWERYLPAPKSAGDEPEPKPAGDEPGSLRERIVRKAEALRRIPPAENASRMAAAWRLVKGIQAGGVLPDSWEQLNRENAPLAAAALECMAEDVSAGLEHRQLDHYVATARGSP